MQGQTWVWIWNGAGAYYQENAQAQIVADKKSYQVGDTAHLLLVTGLDESWAVVTAEGDSVQSQRVIHATGTSVAFDVPITQQAQPNLVVTAILVHNDQLMTAQKSLKVPLTERTLTITATPAKTQYEPGDKASFDVKAVDSAGKPVQADLSFGEVDEALYSVRPDTTGDIVASFYPKREVYLDPQTSFEFYFEGDAGTKSPMLAGLNGLYHPRMAQVKPGSDLVVPKVRKAFPDTAYWNPDVRTGADGHARVEFNFPDALDHVAHHNPRHDGRRQSRRSGDARAGAQEPDRAPGRAALLPPGRRDGDARDRAQLPGDFEGCDLRARCERSGRRSAGKRKR